MRRWIDMGSEKRCCAGVVEFCRCSQSVTRGSFKLPGRRCAEARACARACVVQDGVKSGAVERWSGEGRTTYQGWDGRKARNHRPSFERQRSNPRRHEKPGCLPSACRSAPRRVSAFRSFRLPFVRSSTHVPPTSSRARLIELLWQTSFLSDTPAPASYFSGRGNKHYTVGGAGGRGHLTCTLEQVSAFLHTCSFLASTSSSVRWYALSTIFLASRSIFSAVASEYGLDTGRDGEKIVRGRKGHDKTRQDKTQ